MMAVSTRLRDIVRKAGYPIESEYLLPRNTKFKVTKIEVGRVLGDSKKVIHVEVQ